jgi:formylglycine-generating enzyme required for sulfatase activity
MLTHALFFSLARFSRASLFAGLFLASDVIPLQSAPAVTIDWVTVGNAGNSPDPATGFGAVAYDYKIAATDVTNRQYAEFLNTKDPNGSNSLGMFNDGMKNPTYGGISRVPSNPVGSRYVLTPGREEHPVNSVDWYDAIRFVNWINNGQGAGASTETGAYTIGAVGPGGIPFDGGRITRNPTATVVLPNENEWYKAAFYDPDTNSYFQYATSSNLPPTASGPTVAPNSANYDSAVGNLTDVGAYTGTTSPYGAFDMNGNVFQWNETLNSASGGRGALGGGWGSSLFSTYLSSTSRDRFSIPSTNGTGLGFRLATPEPSSYALAVMAVVALLAVKRRKTLT